MPEHHEIAGPARGEPRSAGTGGACVRVPLDAAPTPRWSEALAAHLASGLAGQPTVAHLQLNRIVQGATIVLEGVEPTEAERLGPVLHAAIDAANSACARAGEGGARPLNMEPAAADEVARTVTRTATTH